LVGFDLFAFFNDTFFMSLMFLLSGLFVWPSLARKGGARFLRNRVLRLGVPFAVMALLAPVAYFAAYRVTVPDPSVPAFWRQWLSLGMWPSGPLWFISALLAFDGIAAGLHRFAPALMESIRRRTSVGLRHPAALFAILIFLSAMFYLPLRVRRRKLGDCRPVFPAKQPCLALFGLFFWRALLLVDAMPSLACSRRRAAWRGTGPAGRRPP